MMEYKISRKQDLHPNFFEQNINYGDWRYGYLNCSHYLLNGLNKIIGCLNLIFLSIYREIYLFYLDTIEIKKNYRKKGLGTKFVNYIIEHDLEKYSKYNIFLLVSNCEQNKLIFFSRLGFLPTKLRKTNLGTHCVMSYPRDKHIEENCNRFFEYFNWKEHNKNIVSSDCKYAYNPNPTGLYWCIKKNIYVTGMEKQSCNFYVKDKEIFTEKKFFVFPQ